MTGTVHVGFYVALVLVDCFLSSSVCVFLFSPVPSIELVRQPTVGVSNCTYTPLSMSRMQYYAIYMYSLYCTSFRLCSVINCAVFTATAKFTFE